MIWLIQRCGHTAESTTSMHLTLIAHETVIFITNCHYINKVIIYLISPSLRVMMKWYIKISCYILILINFISLLYSPHCYTMFLAINWSSGFEIHRAKHVLLTL
jgi:hypothetical protein